MNKIMMTGGGGILGSIIKNGGIDFYNYERNSDKSIEDAIREHDIIIDAAGCKHRSELEDIYNSNVVRAKNVFDISSKYNIRYIFISSTDAENPSDYYGTSKKLHEFYMFQHAYSVMPTVIRYGNILSSESFVKKMIDDVKDGKLVMVHNMEVAKRFIDPAGVVKSLSSAIEKNARGIITPKTMKFSFRDIVGGIERLLGKKANARVLYPSLEIKPCSTLGPEKFEKVIRSVYI